MRTYNKNSHYCLFYLAKPGGSCKGVDPMGVKRCVWPLGLGINQIHHPAVSVFSVLVQYTTHEDVL